jgi:hypothetical protein
VNAVPPLGVVLRNCSMLLAQPVRAAVNPNNAATNPSFAIDFSFDMFHPLQTEIAAHQGTLRAPARSN